MELRSGMQLQLHTYALSAGLGSRQTSLLPGQIRTPHHPPQSPITDWAATSTTVWDEDGGAVNREDSQGASSINSAFTVGERRSTVRRSAAEESMSRETSNYVVRPTEQAVDATPVDKSNSSPFRGEAMATTTKAKTVEAEVGEVTMESEPVPTTSSAGVNDNKNEEWQATVWSLVDDLSRNEGKGVATKVDTLAVAADYASSQSNPFPPLSTNTTATTTTTTTAAAHTEGRMTHHSTIARPITKLESVALSIIAAAGLPMSIVSLTDYITEGQLRLPQKRGNIVSGGTMDPTGMCNNPPLQGYSCAPPNSMGGNKNNHYHQFQLPPQCMPAVNPQTMPFAPVVAHRSPVPHVTPPKSKSELLSDLLYFHANFFPPPPPPRVPKEARSSRARLWYHYATKWDITHRLPPPPRTPFSEMGQKQQDGPSELRRVPYNTDRWLKVCERWCEVTKQQFDYPPENTAVPISPSFVLSQVVTD